MNFIPPGFVALSVAVYWFLGFYILMSQTDLAFPAGMIGTINGLLLFQRIYQRMANGYYVSDYMWLTLYLPPPILAALGLLLWGLS